MRTIMVIAAAAAYVGSAALLAGAVRADDTAKPPVQAPPQAGMKPGMKSGAGGPPRQLVLPARLKNISMPACSWDARHNAYGFAIRGMFISCPWK